MHFATRGEGLRKVSSIPQAAGGEICGEMPQFDRLTWPKDAYFNSDWLRVRGDCRSVAARGMGESRPAGRFLLQTGRIEEVKDAADHPIAEGDSENEGNYYGK